MLRRGPDLLPHSWWLLGVTFIASFLLSLVSIAIILPGEPLDAHVTLVLTLLPTVYYFAVLLIAGFPQRFTQTMTAMFGADIALTIIHLVVFLLVSLLGDRNSALLLIQLITLWSIPVQGHIISRAIERHWLLGIGIAFSGFILSLLTYAAISTP